MYCFFFFQAEDGIRDSSVTGVQTCALPISGFAPFAALIEIRSEIPVMFPVSLRVASHTESITVKEANTLLDTTNTGTGYTLGKLSLQDWGSTTPGREAIDVIQAQPGGWLEA